MSGINLSFVNDTLQYLKKKKLTIANGTLSIFWGAIGIRHSLDRVSVITEEHDGNSGDLSDSSLEILITGGHDIGLVLSYSVYQTIVSIGPLQTDYQRQSD